MADIEVLQGQGRIFVQSEDEPERTILETRITNEDLYEKHQGTKVRNRI